MDGLTAAIPVKRLSQTGVSSTHRFYDTSPISPSGKLVALTEFDFDDRLPNPGDEASVVVLQCDTGDVVYRTRTHAWDTQLGAQAQWGASDNELFFNRMSLDTWRPNAVCVDPIAGTERSLGGPVYVVSNDGKRIISPNLARIGRIQPGYGVIVPPEISEASPDYLDTDGLYVTDVRNGDCRLAVSFRQIVAVDPAAFSEARGRSGTFYGFHAKWSPNDQRIIFIVRWKSDSMRMGKSLNWLITMNSEFEDIRIALTPSRWAGGHHPNWCPDSEHIIMNLLFPYSRPWIFRLRYTIDRIARRLSFPRYRNGLVLRFAKFRFDGRELHSIVDDAVGSGHPTFHQGLDSVVTDAYPWEPVALGDGSVPIRLISSESGREQVLVQVGASPRFLGPLREWRVDPHPAWNRTSDRLVFNGYVDGARSVFVADLSELLNKVGV